MKKFITFSNFMVLLTIMTIFFYFIPAVKITARGLDYSTTVNLFTATFGGSYSIRVSETAYHLHGTVNATPGLIFAFVFSIVAILLTLAKMKVKIATLFALPFYVTSGVLVLCSSVLITTSTPTIYKYANLGGAITVGVFFCILAFLALVDFIATIAKPKQQQPSAY